MPKQVVDELDGVFHVLADPTRRSVVQRLGHGAAATTELARPFSMALPSFTQHLALLERHGLVRSSKQGRVRTYELVPAPLRSAEQWMVSQRRVWESRLDQFDAYVRGLTEEPR
jgi:DNA-binding transcriptional ArsR family regulator